MAAGPLAYPPIAARALFHDSRHLIHLILDSRELRPPDTPVAALPATHHAFPLSLMISPPPPPRPGHPTPAPKRVAFALGSAALFRTQVTAPLFVSSLLCRHKQPSPPPPTPRGPSALLTPPTPQRHVPSPSGRLDQQVWHASSASTAPHQCCRLVLMWVCAGGPPTVVFVRLLSAHPLWAADHHSHAARSSQRPPWMSSINVLSKQFD